MEHTDFQDLLNKYLTNTITTHEWQLLSRLLNDPAYQQQLEAIIDQELHDHAFEATPNEQLLALIQQNLKQQINTNRPKGKIVSLYVKRVAVAIVLLTLMTGSAY